MSATTPSTGDPAGALGLEDLCAEAVDPLEVAAGLEADGMNDEAARRAGHSDVFAFAETLFAEADRRPRAVEPAPNPWRGTAWRHLLRGLLFGLPGLCYLVATPLLTGPGAAPVLIVSLLASWTLGQGVAYLGYVRAGQADAAGAARVMRYGLVAGALATLSLTALSGLVLGADGPATALAAGQCLYLLAATVVLVNGEEGRLLLAFGPGVTATLAHLATGESGGLPVPPAVWWAWTATVGATVALAFHGTRRDRAARSPGRPVVTRQELAAAAPHAAFGLLAGGLLSHSLLNDLAGRPASATATTAAVLALSLSMGAAEWTLFGYRRATHDLLHRNVTVAAFSRGARVALSRAVTRYLLSLALLLAVVAALAGVPVEAAPMWVLGGHLALGCAFFVALTLLSCGRVSIVLGGCALALAGEASVVRLVGDAGPGVVEAAASGTLFAALGGYALVALSHVTCHR
ncbi:hypothetical protein SMC26_41030 [Actinomadura fulvescens]|uniref:Uncharacterized protein n=1 Tax=Actinomadura fulvescens TaxID=46160 RepID=A0ABN3PP37_9ACTN